MGKRRNQRRSAARASKRMRDPGPDPGGNFDVSPYAARGHVVEVAPKELRSNPNSDQFPKRIVTQRVIDRYRAHGHITEDEWKVANRLWAFWVEKEMQAKTTSGYDPVMVQSSPSIDGRLAKYLDAALGFNRMMRAVPYHLKGVVRAVVVEDWPASDWARKRGIGHRDAKAYGMECLRAGLQALVGRQAT